MMVAICYDVTIGIDVSWHIFLEKAQWIWIQMLFGDKLLPYRGLNVCFLEILYDWRLRKFEILLLHFVVMIWRVCS